MGSAHPRETCAVCGSRATAWSTDWHVLEDLVTREEQLLLVAKGAWCAAHARSGSVERIGFTHPFVV